MPEKELRQCGNCEFWKPFPPADQENPSEDDHGHCRRYPPYPIVDLKEPVSADTMGESAGWWMFPMTDRCDWCGEWRQKGA
jgi:hypothetical protein